MASWFGSYGFQRTLIFKNSLPPAPEPPVFSPLDISGCQLWLDANDTSTIEVNGDLSGANVNRVMKWFDKAQPSSQRHFQKISDPSGSGLYNVDFINKLNVVRFEPNCSMEFHDGGLTFPFNDRTFFCVFKPQTDLSGLAYPYIQIFIGQGGGAFGFYFGEIAPNTYRYSCCSNGVVCGIEIDLPNTNPYKNRIVYGMRQSATDLSSNKVSFDTVDQTLASSDLANYTLTQQQYTLGVNGVATAFDLAELILYEGVLDDIAFNLVTDYLADKWNLSGRNVNEG